MSHESYMKTALALAEKGRGFTGPNPMVGAVVVKNKKVIGMGYHEAVGQAHAEVNAIDDAGKNAKGATIYVTLEPCNHTGRTPPCTQKILAAGIKRVVVAINDPNPDVTGGGNAFLQERGIEVITGICEPEARKLNEIFIKYITTGRPFVIAKCASTLDGQIATRTGDSKWVTGAIAREYVHWLRHAADGIMVGIGTVQNDNPSLTTRLETLPDQRPGPGKDPARIIIDTQLKISPNARVITQTSDAKTYIITGENINADKKRAIESKGAEIIEIPLKNKQIDLAKTMDRMGAAGITSILLEGGGRLMASAFQSGIVDKVNFFYAPKISGGSDGVPICTGQGPALMKNAFRLTDITTRQFGEDVMIEGYINKDLSVSI